jgi:hypothetical protein
MTFLALEMGSPNEITKEQPKSLNAQGIDTIL